MKERWILNGNFANGAEYMCVFESMFELLDTMNEIYDQWEYESDMYTDEELINPFSLSMEQDLTNKERIDLFNR